MTSSTLCPASCVTTSDSSSDDSELYDYLELLQLMPFRSISVPYKISHEENGPTQKQRGEQQKLEKLQYNHVYGDGHTDLTSKEASDRDSEEDTAFNDDNECNTISEGEYI